MQNLEFMKGEISIRQPAEVWRRKPWRTHRQRATQKWGTARIATLCGTVRQLNLVGPSVKTRRFSDSAQTIRTQMNRVML